MVGLFIYRFTNLWYNQLNKLEFIEEMYVGTYKKMS